MNDKEILEGKVDQSYYLKYSMENWRKVLANEVDAYVYQNSYLIKRFDSIAYEFYDLKTAREVIEDNLYMLLRYKYFILQDDQVDKVIEKIVRNFLENLKTTLIKVTFDWENNLDHKVLKEIPQSCVAFQNGVYDFAKNEWLFKVYKTNLTHIQNTYYEYDKNYVILWYLNIEFDPLEIDITKISSEDLVELFHSTTKELNNYGFNLVYNMSFNEDNKFDMKKFQHLAEIMGFTLSTRFIQSFIMFIGTGSNGKNSLLDGCFSSHLRPKPINIDLDSIEEDKFITGALENRYHNFYLESNGKSYNRSKVIKQLTGSVDQTIEDKGKTKKTGYLNIKHIFSANERDDIKFGDTSHGFVRRINLYEVFYKWDSRGDYLKLGNYLKTNLSADLRELKRNLINTVSYIYIGMWGIAQATKNFTQPFNFTYNNYSIKYENIDSSVKRFMQNFTVEDLAKMIVRNGSETLLYCDDTRIYKLPRFNKFFNIKNEISWKTCVNDLDNFITFFEDKNLWININQLKEYSGLITLSQVVFTQEALKFCKTQPKSYYNNQKYIPISIIGRRVKF